MTIQLSFENDVPTNFEKVAVMNENDLVTMTALIFQNDRIM